MSAVPPILSLTETQALTAYRSFLLTNFPTGVEVFKGQGNRVPEPIGADFVVVTPIIQERLEYNQTTFQDNIVMGFINTNILTITSVTRGRVAIGNLILDTTGNILPNTIITGFQTGSGGVGSYTVSNSQTLAREILYIGVRSDLVAVKLTVQLDIHGPNSSDNTRIIETLFRSDRGVYEFHTSGFDITPLYSETPRQVPFINAEQQYEFRWTLDTCVQINPIVYTPQQFADQLEVTVNEIDAVFPP